MDMCVFPNQVMVMKKNVPLNSAYVSIEYNQILQSYFREQGGVLHILINKPTKIMCSYSLKIRLGQTDEPSLGGKRLICAI